MPDHPPCACSLDEGPCYDHLDVEVLREGASLRTGDELLLTFLEDASELIDWDRRGPSDPTRLSVDITIEACHEDLAVQVPARWLANDERREELEDQARRVEDLVTTQGFYVLWDDGYVIGRPTDDCPLEGP